MKFIEAIREAVAFRDISPELMEAAMEILFRGEAHDAQIGALAVALQMKGETAEELAAAVRVMRRHATRVELVASPLLDTCGTGGDGLSTFNISTVSALVLASLDVPIAKHGNRAVSSTTGSADLLEELGVKIDLEAESARRCFEEAGIVFLFAPRHHGALRHAAAARRAIGVRSLFNLLGPLANPAAVTHQIVGVYEPHRVRQLAEVLQMLGLEGAWVVHGEGGFDEVSPVGVTRVARVQNGTIDEFEVHPRDFGVEPVSVEGLRGGDARVNAAITRAILRGEHGAPRAAVLVNAAAGLSLVRGYSLEESAERVAEALDSGRAAQRLERFIAASQRGSA